MHEKIFGQELYMSEKRVSACVRSTLLLVYRVLYICALLIVFPMLLWNRFVRGKREHIRRRLFPRIRFPLPGTGPIVWVHAVSVGEVYAVAPLVHALVQANPMVRVVVSTITQTGHEAAKKAIAEAKAYVFLPLDITTSIRRAFCLGVPSLVIFSEGDVWPLFAHEAKKRGAITAIINGKMSGRTADRFSRVRLLGRWLYSFIDIFCVQNQTFYDRFLSLGVPKESLHVTGNTKADVSFPLLSPLEKAAFRVSLGLGEQDRLLVLASTHAPEEEELLVRLLPLLHRRLEWKIAVVPRHPERFSEVFRIAKMNDANATLLSTYRGTDPWKIIVIDALGLLTKVYQLATMAVVCGSFTDRVGGHNILEPAVVGIPVIVGPYMHSQPTLFQSAKGDGAILQVSYDTVADTVERLLLDDGLYNKAATHAFLWADSLRGATARTASILLAALEKLGVPPLSENQDVH